MLEMSSHSLSSFKPESLDVALNITGVEKNTLEKRVVAVNKTDLTKLNILSPKNNIKSKPSTVAEHFLFHPNPALLH